MDARNHLLLRLAAIGAATAGPVHAMALKKMAELGWWQEWWIGRNLQRHLGPHAKADAPRLPSADVAADTLWGPASGLSASDLSDTEAVDRAKLYLLGTLEMHLELLDKAPADDDALYFFRAALAREEALNEDLLVLANQHGLQGPRGGAGSMFGVELPAPVATREPLWFPSGRSSFGVSPDEGFAVEHQGPRHEVDLPEFEIDAQTVTWQQYTEFVNDGGYDRQELWQSGGWEWLQGLVQREGKRAPAFVEQMGGTSGAALQQHFGQPMRMLGNQVAMHVSWWEADAWCRWAGRRLPAEAEWDLAARQGTRRGFRWGEVHEWCANTFKPYPGCVPGPLRSLWEPHVGRTRVLRGASFATRPLLRTSSVRTWAQPQDDHLFCGFRSCAF
jgi:formylglycine-generating enzyme required for sulfatase activity